MQDRTLDTVDSVHPVSADDAVDGSVHGLLDAVVDGGGDPTLDSMVDSLDPPVIPFSWPVVHYQFCLKR